MGCGVAPLVGINCNDINLIWQMIVIAAGFVVLVIVLKKSSRSRVVPNGLIAAVVLTSPFVWTYLSDKREMRVVRAMHDEFSLICYQQSKEEIRSVPTRMSSLILSPPSGVEGEWGFELFFGRTGPKREWAGIPIATSVPERQEDRKGMYELRYTHLPQHRVVSGQEMMVHGVLQQVIDLAKNQVIAERQNFIWGRDFNRSAFCLGSRWFEDNDDFAERVLGSRYLDSKTGKPRSPSKPTQYIRAIQEGTEVTDVTTRTYQDKEMMPVGGSYDDWNRKIHLPNGAFHMLTYRGDTIMPIVATLERGDGYVFVLLPEGGLRNWPVRKLLFDFRSKTGEQIGKVYVQVPPGVDWTSGWGFDPKDVHITENRITFWLLGKRVRNTDKYGDSNNGGQYAMRYRYVAEMGAWQ